jgi:SNF2 family DNA or RNA helicase
MASLSAGCILSSHKQEQRDDIIRRFNDPNDELRILTIPSNISCVGLNMHHACNHCIVTENPVHIANLIQSCGRIVRHGQREHCHVTRLLCNDTFDPYGEMLALEKYIVTLGSEGSLVDPQIIGEARKYPATSAAWG